jgi:hypothetical protein
VLVFTPRPTPKQVGSVTQAGEPYGIARDPVRDRVWGGLEVARIPTVQNPYTLGGDSTVTAGVVQIVDVPA